MEKNQNNYMKEYYQNNKAKYQEIYNNKKHCDVCNSDYPGLNFSKHLKTYKHLRNVENGSNVTLTKEMYDKILKMLDNKEKSE